MKFPEWLPDRDDHENPGLVQCKNVLPDTFYKPIKALVDGGTAMTDIALGAYSLKDESGVAFNFSGDDTELYRLDSGDWTSIDSAFTTTAENRWVFVEFGTNCVATNLDDVMQVYDVEVDSSFAALAGTPPQAKYLAVVGDFLVAGYISTSANTVQWSGINDITEWTAGTAESDSQVIPEGGAITGLAGGEYGLVFQETQITRMNYQGPPLNFSFDVIEHTHGTRAHGSIAQYGIYTYYLGLSGFYMTDGTQSQSISPEKVNSYFQAKYDDTLPYKVTSVVDPKERTITWSYVGLDSPDSLPNWLIIYNWELQRWSEAEIRHELLFTCLSNGLTLDELDTLYPDIDEMIPSLDSSIFKGGIASSCAISLTHQLSTFTGAALEGVIETAEYELNPGDKTVLTEVWPLIDGNITVTVNTRANYQDTPEPTGDIDVNTFGFAPFTENGRYHSFTFTFTDWTKASGFTHRGASSGGY
jgi:hypothetical protein